MTEACKSTLASLFRCRYRLTSRLERVDGPLRTGLLGLLREVDLDTRRVERRAMASGDEPHARLNLLRCVVT